MIRFRIRKIWTWALSLMVVLLVVVLAGSAYLLNFALSPQHRSVDEALARLYKHHAYVRPWVDSLKAVSAIHDTMVVINGTRLHAAYIPAPRTSHKVAFLIHGYKDCYAMMLHVGYIYHHLGYNLFLPDLYAHGESEGNHIRMGWLDRLDVMQWAHIANAKFRGDSTSTQMVVHGISMGAATAMCLSGMPQPPFVKCYVEDCGFTSVHDEFEHELKQMYGLPAFPILNVGSAMCKMKYGWNFEEASPIQQVKKSHLPMLVIHGTADDFVPTWMAQPIYDAKPSPKQIYMAPGSAHARSLADHREAYTRIITQFTHTYIK